MIFTDRTIEVFLFGVAIICIALLQLYKGVTLSYKSFLDPSVVFKDKKEDKFSFYFSIYAQVFVGTIAIIAAIIVSFIGI
jgi:hypothetical protein